MWNACIQHALHLTIVIKCHDALNIYSKQKFSNVFVALIYTLSHNTRCIAFQNLLTCNIPYVQDHDMWPLTMATCMIYQPWLTMCQVWKDVLNFWQLYLSICTFSLPFDLLSVKAIQDVILSFCFSIIKLGGNAVYILFGILKQRLSRTYASNKAYHNVSR